MHVSLIYLLGGIPGWFPPTWWPAWQFTSTEHVGNGPYLNIWRRTGRVFLSNQAGKVFLATVPPQGSGKTLQLDAANQFLDITDEVHLDNEFGLMALAFHRTSQPMGGSSSPTINCDKTQSATCAGRCSCNSDVGCDPSKLGADNGKQPCQYQSVVFSPADGYT